MKFPLFRRGLIIFLAVLGFPAVAAVRTNPDISVNLLLLGQKNFGKKKEAQKSRPVEMPGSFLERWRRHTSPTAGQSGAQSSDGFSVQEVEFYFKSNIDPYWTGSVSFGVSSHLGHWDMGLEEAFVETLFIPHLTVKAGKFYALLEKHNHLHTHTYPFIDPPLINSALFGAHGLNGSGVSLAWLTPLPWYFEATAQGFYGMGAIGKPSGILFLKSLWDIWGNSTLELNVSYGSGVKNFTHLLGGALTYKRQPQVGSGRHTVEWTTQFLQGLSEPGRSGTKRVGFNSEGRAPSGGVTSYIQWRFLKSGWLQGRGEWTVPQKWNKVKTQKYSALLAFTPTEYSAIRLQYHTFKDSHSRDWGHGVLVQTNMSLGTHPAHLY